MSAIEKPYAKLVIIQDGSGCKGYLTQYSTAHEMTAALRAYFLFVMRTTAENMRKNAREADALAFIMREVQLKDEIITKITTMLYDKDPMLLSPTDIDGFYTFSTIGYKENGEAIAYVFAIGPADMIKKYCAIYEEVA